MEIAAPVQTKRDERQMPPRTSVSVVVLAFNEEAELRSSVESVISAAAAADGLEWEIIIVNDGSSDGTAAIAADLEREYSFVRCIHHDRNRGFGAAFRSGLQAADHEYVTFFPGDNIVSSVMLREILRHLGEADLVCAFPVNTECRRRSRQILSSFFSFVYKQTFNLHLRSIHTTPAFRTRQLREIRFHSTGYSLPSEIMVKLLRRGCSFMELPGYLNPGKNKSSAIRPKILGEVVGNYLKLLFEVFVSCRNQYSKAPTRVIPKELRE